MLLIGLLSCREATDQDIWEGDNGQKRDEKGGGPRHLFYGCGMLRPMGITFVRAVHVLDIVTAFNGLHNTCLARRVVWVRPFSII